MSSIMIVWIPLEMCLSNNKVGSKCYIKSLNLNSNFSIIIDKFEFRFKLVNSGTGSNLTKVRLVFTLSHRGSDNYPLLIVFSANYIDQSIVTFMRLKLGIFKNNALRFKNAI